MPWDDLDPATATFTTTNMLIPYKGAWSKQFGQKIVKNTGFNWNWSRPVIINDTYFTDETEIWRYDSNRDYQNVTCLIQLTASIPGGADPGNVASGWYFTRNDTEGTVANQLDTWTVTLTTSWFNLEIPGARTFCCKIRANSSGTGFEIAMKDGTFSQTYLIGWIIRMERVDAGTEVS